MGRAGTSWDDVMVFSAVAEELSFTRAAARLHVSVPTVSTRVQRLERELGHRLLRRTTARVEVTPAGRQLQDWAVRALSSWEELHRRWEAVRPPLVSALPPRLTLGVCHGDVAHLQRGLDEEHPGTDWRVTVVANPAEALARLRAGAVDALVWLRWPFSGPADTSGTRSVTIWRPPMHVFLSVDHPRCADAEVTLADLSGEPLIGRTDPVMNSLLSRFYQFVGGFSASFTHVSDDRAEIEHVIRRGGGIDIGPGGARFGVGIARRPVAGAPTSRLLLSCGATDATLPVPALLAALRRISLSGLEETAPDLHKRIIDDPAAYPEFAPFRQPAHRDGLDTVVGRRAG